VTSSKILGEDHLKFRIFTNDVDVNRYSCFGDIEAGSLLDAKQKAFAKTINLPSPHGLKVLVIPHERVDLWPNGLTGKVPSDAETHYRAVNRKSRA